jgi:amidase
MSPVLAAAPPPLGFVGPDVAFDTLIPRLVEYVGYTTYHNVVGAPAMSVPLNWSPVRPADRHVFAAASATRACSFQLAYQLELARPMGDKAPSIHA